MASGLVVIGPSLHCGFEPHRDTPLDAQQTQAVTLISEGKNVVLHGRSGSGKTTVAEAVAHVCLEMEKPVNFYGIQDLFRAPYKSSPLAISTEGLFFPSIVAEASVIILDNYTAMSSNIICALDLCIQAYADTNVPFGGKQLVFIGDLFAFSPFDVYDVPEAYHRVVLKEDYVHCSLLKEFLDGIVDSMRTRRVDVNTSCIINHMLYRIPPFKKDLIVCMTSNQVLEHNRRVFHGYNAYMLAPQSGLKENEIPNMISLGKMVRFTHDVRNKQGEITIRRGSRAVLKSVDGADVIEYENIKYKRVSEMGTLLVSVEGEEYTIYPQKINGESRFPVVGTAAITPSDLYEEEKEDRCVYISTAHVPNSKVLGYIYSIASMFISIYQIHLDKHSIELQECMS